jgi:hypothetical protein
VDNISEDKIVPEKLERERDRERERGRERDPETNGQKSPDEASLSKRT